MKNTLLGRGILLPTGEISKDKINLVAGAICGNGMGDYWRRFINRESKDAIRSAVNELERAGYIERHQTTDESGKFSSNEYIIHAGLKKILHIGVPMPMELFTQCHAA